MPLNADKTEDIETEDIETPEKESAETEVENPFKDLTLTELSEKLKTAKDDERDDLLEVLAQKSADAEKSLRRTESALRKANRESASRRKLLEEKKTKEDKGKEDENTEAASLRQKNAELERKLAEAEEGKKEQANLKRLESTAVRLRFRPLKTAGGVPSFQHLVALLDDYEPEDDKYDFDTALKQLGRDNKELLLADKPVPDADADKGGGGRKKPVTIESIKKKKTADSSYHRF